MSTHNPSHHINGDWPCGGKCKDKKNFRSMLMNNQHAESSRIRISENRSKGTGQSEAGFAGPVPILLPY